MSLRICIDARLVDGESGGIQQVLIGLASGFSALTDGDEQYNFLTYRDGDAWLRPYLGKNCHILPGPPIPFRKHFKKSLLGGFARRLAHHIGIQALVRVPVSDGTVERAGFDVVHFVSQAAFLTSLPSIYTPHDLQFLAFPENFTARERAIRGRWYRAFCSRARAVVAMTPWGREELREHLGLPPEKIVVIPWAPVTEAYDVGDLATVAKKFQLPRDFLFYPAQTWPHKNHLALIEALASLRDRGDRVAVVCSGKMNEHGINLQRRAHDLGVADQIHFLGFVTPQEIAALFQLCRGLVFPSLYEGWGLPLQEAMLAERPVACSNVGPLPYVAAGAALLFDARKPSSIADAMRQLWNDDALRAALVEKGKIAVQGASWAKTARAYRDLYRRLA